MRLGDRAKTHSSIPAEPSGRSSPRQHFRRGHIRVLDRTAGRMTWVSDALVGAQSDGRIDKDYMLMI